MSEQFSLKVGSQAHSMALFILCYIPKEKIECIDTTNAVLHRAAYPTWMEGSESFMGSVYFELLTKANKDLERAFRASVDVAILEDLPQFVDKGLKLKDIFSLESRHEILLSANDLKKIGLVSKINKVTPTKSAQMKTEIETFKKCRSIEEFRLAAKAANQSPEEPEIKDTVMTLDELKSKFPAIYAQAKAEGYTEGVDAEFDRVNAALVFNHLDPKGVKEAIASKKPLTATQMAEFSLKAMSPSALAAIAKDSEVEVKTEEIENKETTEKEAALKVFQAGIDAQLGRKKEVAAK